jgi:hypothetical protein
MHLVSAAAGDLHQQLEKLVGPLLKVNGFKRWYEFITCSNTCVIPV